MAITQFRGAGITMDDPLGQFGSVDVTCDVCGYAQSYYTPAATQAETEQLLQKVGWTFGRLVCCPPERDASTSSQEMLAEQDRLLAMIADGLVTEAEFLGWAEFRPGMDCDGRDHREETTGRDAATRVVCAGRERPIFDLGSC